MTIALIVAMDRSSGIGKNNSLPWHLPGDMKFFKETTTGHIVVMGRKNFESIPEKYRPLPNRKNVVLTRNVDFTRNDCNISVFNDIPTLLDTFKNEEDRTIFIIGGAEIYKQFLDLKIVDELYITFIDHDYDTDVKFVGLPDDDCSYSLESSIDEVDDKTNVHYSINHYKKIK